MTDHSDLVARLRHGEGQDWDMPYATREEAATLIETQAAELERLGAELAGRDAEIAAWLRKGTDTYPHGTYARCRELHAYWTDAADMIERGVYRGNAATAIASGAYRETEGD